jgi:hypothetical protein
VNGTPQGDGFCRRYFLRVSSRMRTAREAVARTYGLSPERYPSWMSERDLPARPAEEAVWWLAALSIHRL